MSIAPMRAKRLVVARRMTDAARARNSPAEAGAVVLAEIRCEALHRAGFAVFEADQLERHNE